MPSVGHLPSWVLSPLISWFVIQFFADATLGALTVSLVCDFHLYCCVSLPLLSESYFPSEPSIPLPLRSFPWPLTGIWTPSLDFASTRASLVDQIVKNPPAMQETPVWSLGWEDSGLGRSWVGKILGWEDPLENEMATHSSILAWRIPWTEEPGWLHSIESHRVGHGWRDTRTHARASNCCYLFYLYYLFSNKMTTPGRQGLSISTRHVALGEHLAAHS